jgi:DNA-binding winged helix-turn-helix (wHTH) protein
VLDSNERGQSESAYNRPASSFSEFFLNVLFDRCMLDKPQQVYAFGPFIVDPTVCVLSFNGQEIKLGPKAFDLLLFFVTHPRELIDREQIKLGVWGTLYVADNNVDKQIAAIRKVLFQNDPSHEYIPNTPRRGWRFMADVIQPQDDPLPETALAPMLPQETESAAFGSLIARQPSAPLFGIVAFAFIALAAAVLIATRGYPPPNSQPLEIRVLRLTTDGGPKSGPLVSDGLNVYFSEGAPGAADSYHRPVAAVPAGGGDLLPHRSPLDPPAMLLSIAQGTRDLLYGRWLPNGDSALFIWRRKRSLLEQAAQIRGNARISPDAGSIAYTTSEHGESSITIRDLGVRPNIRRIPAGPVLGSVAWSPDGSRIRFPVHDAVSETAVFWEVRRDGSNLHRLPLVSSPRSSFGDACWTADGHYFVYSEIQTYG